MKRPFRNGTVFALCTDLGDIALLAEVAGLGSYEDVKANSAIVIAYGRNFAVLDLPALIRARRASGRQKDLLDLPELESLLEAGEPKS